jgi:subtilisin family serine protease
VRHRRAFRFFVVLLTLIGLAGLFRFAPSIAAGASLLPPEITVNLPLGASTTRTITLNNPTNSPLTVTLYEAYAVPPLPVPSIEHPPESPLKNTFPVTTTSFLVYLNSNADLSAASSISNWDERGEFVYRRLTEHATQSQERLQQELRQRGYEFQSFWIVNAIAVEGDVQVAEWIGRQPEVAAVQANQTFPRPLPLPEPETTNLVPGSVGWHLEAIGATGVWQNFGVEGAGITVAALDSGVLWNHTVLEGNYRGNSNGDINHNYHWMDTAGTPASRIPYDPIGHGTHVIGTIAGRRGTDIVQSGVAPRARWIAVRGCGDYFCLEQDMLEAAQWLLAPTNLEGNQPRPDLRPHIINNSWGFTGDGSAWFEGVLAAWRAAGIFASFSAGNSGPNCNTIDSPALSPNAFAIGATQQDSTIARFSALGPTYDGRVKPDLVAPGSGIYAPFGDGRFVSLSGTSMASPMVAGAVALIWSANPALLGDVATTESILRESATPLFSDKCGSLNNSRPNNVFGMGLLDVDEAVRQARVDVPWVEVPNTMVIPPQRSIEIPITFDAGQVAALGTYQGRIAVDSGSAISHTTLKLVVVESPGTSAVSGRLIDGDTGTGLVGTLTFGDNVTLHSDQNGVFSGQVPQGNYTLTATAYGYLPLDVTAIVTDVTYLPLRLTADLPRLEISPLQKPLQVSLGWGEHLTQSVRVFNSGSQPLVITPTIPSDEWQITPLTFTTPYTLTTFEVLRLENEQVYTPGVVMPFQVPLFGRYVTRLYPTSNGWIATARTGDARRTVRCMPTGFAYDGMLAPLWADLDPSQGGSIKAGLVDEDTYVVSYEAIPLRDNYAPNPPRYTFQVVLRRNGTIEYRYGQMGALPSRWAVGMNSKPERGQSLGCFESPVRLGYQGWQMMNQTSPLHWMAVEDTLPIVIPPGGEKDVSIGFHGYSPSPWLTRPMVGRVQLQSNDIRHPLVNVTAQVTMGLPPYRNFVGFTGNKVTWNIPP